MSEVLRSRMASGRIGGGEARCLAVADGRNVARDQVHSEELAGDDGRCYDGRNPDGSQAHWFLFHARSGRLLLIGRFYVKGSKAKAKEDEMDESTVKIEVTCQNEMKVVGAIDVPVGAGKNGFLLASRVVWSGFRPVTEEYRLPKKMSGDGKILRCPRCEGILCIAGSTKAKEKDVSQEKRDEARQRAVRIAQEKGSVHEHFPASGIDPGMMPITLGKTRVEAVA